MATPTKLSRITGLSWSMISIIGLSSSCKAQNHSLCTQAFNNSLSCSPTWFLFYLRWFNGHEKASYLFENGNGESASGQLTGAEQNKRQALHSMQHSGVGTTFSRYLETGAALQQLGWKHQHIQLFVKIFKLSPMLEMWMGLTYNQTIPLPTHRNMSNTELCTSQVCTLAPSCFFPGVAAVIFHCVSSCSSNLRDVSNSPWWVSWTSRNRKFVNPNRTSSRQSEKSTNRLCKEFWAMSRSSSSMWIVNLGKRTKMTINTWVWDDINIVREVFSPWQ